MKKIVSAALMLAATALPTLAGGYSLLNDGIEYFNRKDWANAVVWLSKAISAGDLIADQAHVAYYDRGVSYARLGQLKEAVDDYTAAIDIRPDDLGLITDRAFAYIAIGQPQSAIADLTLVYLKQPDNFAIGFQTGLVSWQLGNYEQAAKIFGRFAKTNTTSWLWFQLANIRLGRAVLPIQDEKFDPTPWPNPLKALFAGTITADEVMKMMEKSAIGAAQACDADFYVGEWHLARSEVAAGKSLMEKAVEVCPREATERRMAEFEFEQIVGNNQMIRIPTISAAIALFSIQLSQIAMAAEASECRLTQMASLKFETMPDGRIMIPVTINDHPLSFMVDTGGNTATINWSQAKQFGLQVKLTSRSLLGVAGSSTNSYVTVDSFSVGKLKGKGLPMYIEERNLGATDGTFSPDMLQGYDVDIDFAHSIFNLFSQDHCRGKVVYWTTTGFIVVKMDVARDGHVRVPVTIDGKEIIATLDTGSTTSLVSMKAAEDLGIEPKSPGLKLQSDANGYQMYSYPFHSLDFGGVSVTNPQILISTDNFTKGLGSDLILGIGILRRLHLYIAYDEERLYITPAEAN